MRRHFFNTQAFFLKSHNLYFKSSRRSCSCTLNNSNFEYPHDKPMADKFLAFWHLKFKEVVILRSSLPSSFLSPWKHHLSLLGMGSLWVSLPWFKYILSRYWVQVNFGTLTGNGVGIQKGYRAATRFPERQAWRAGSSARQLCSHPVRPGLTYPSSQMPEAFPQPILRAAFHVLSHTVLSLRSLFSLYLWTSAPRRQGRCLLSHAV